MPLEAPFHALRDEALAAVDEQFAEPVRLSFLRHGVVDPDRPAVEISAILRVDQGKSENLSGGDRAAWKGRVAAGNGRLSIDPAIYAGPAIRRGDKVKALARRGEPWFEVLFVDDRSETRLVVHLGEA